MIYDLEIEKAVEKVQMNGSRKVLIQLPDGLKPQAGIIKDEIEAKTDAEVLIWMGSCFGACDIPYYTENIGIQLIIQWGHSAWDDKSGMIPAAQEPLQESYHAGSNPDYDHREETDNDKDEETGFSLW